ncbi:ATP-binding protein [Streptomyces sp. NPDC059506]|uniref:ATP-binding protein n=1 Tax=Streptomyces TaxID=1883 RepID=UPI000CA90684|nr:hypothetical protein C0036_06680 [Streptomyces sp. DJ]
MPSLSPSHSAAAQRAARFEMSLRVDPATIHRVRRLVRDRLVEWERADHVREAVFGVGELLANVHKHVPGGRCVLDVRRTPGGVRVAVRDGDPRMPVVRQPEWDSEDGRGLFLLVHSVHDWGTVRLPGGKEVWFTTGPDDAEH